MFTFDQYIVSAASGFTAGSQHADINYNWLQHRLCLISKLTRTSSFSALILLSLYVHEVLYKPFEVNVFALLICMISFFCINLLHRGWICMCALMRTCLQMDFINLHLMQVQTKGKYILAWLHTGTQCVYLNGGVGVQTSKKTNTQVDNGSGVFQPHLCFLLGSNF